MTGSQPRTRPALGTNPMNQKTLYFPDFTAHSMNAHMTILGASRSGRTATAKLRALREHETGVQPIIIDRKGEYTKLISNLGGTTLRPGTGPEHALNPLAADLGHLESPYSRGTFLTVKITLLQHLLQAVSGPPDTPGQADAIGTVLAYYYRDQEIETRDNPGEGGLQDLLEYHNQQGQPLTRRPLANLQALLESPLVASGPVKPLPAAPMSYDLSEVPPELVPAAIIICAGHIWNQALTKPTPRLMVVDSCPDSSPATEALGEIQRRARKQLLAMTLIPTNTSAFLTRVNPPGYRILQNSAAILALRQQKTVLPLLAETLRLDPETTTLLGRESKTVAIYSTAEENPQPVRIARTQTELALL